MKHKDEIRYVHTLLKHRDRWYIDVSAPDISMLQEIAEKAKTRADSVLSRATVADLWKAYNIWMASDRIKMRNEEEGWDYYMEFLSDFVWQVGYNYLRGMEKDWYADSINLRVMFI